MPSRDPKDLTLEMRVRWERSLAEWLATYPNDKVPFLTQTLRTNEEQNKLFAQGRTTPGKVVTNARAGQSLHNYGHAFDIAFKDAKGKVDWEDTEPYSRFAAIAKRHGLAWGGDWKSFKDVPHFEPPNYTWRNARAGQAPVFPKLTPVSKVCKCCGRPLA